MNVFQLLDCIFRQNFIPVFFLILFLPEIVSINGVVILLNLHFGIIFYRFHAVYILFFADGMFRNSQIKSMILFILHDAGNNSHNRKHCYDASDLQELFFPILHDVPPSRLKSCSSCTQIFSVKFDFIITIRSFHISFFLFDSAMDFVKFGTISKFPVNTKKILRFLTGRS